MIVPIPFGTRKDGVNLIKRIDAVVDDKGNIIPTGFKIHKIGTDEFYDSAIDVEGSLYSYEPTNIPIESEVEDLGLQQSDLPG